MKRLQTPISSTLAALFSTAALLAACGSDDDVTPAPPPPPAAPTQIVGTAAVGAALGGANVAVTDSSGSSVCSEATIVTSGIGAYSCSLIAGKSAPFIVVITDPSGRYAPLVGVTTTTPAAGASLTLNATPLTTAIVAQLAPDRSALSVVATPSLIDAAKLSSITSQVIAQLADVLAALGAPAGYDPFTTAITAATASVSGNSADKLIDLLRIDVVNGVQTVGTIDNPGAAVALADGGSSAAPKLALPAASALGLTDALKQITADLQKCFALPLAQRVTSTDTTLPAAEGGPRLTGIASDCQTITHEDYLHDGYTAGQAFYRTMTDEAMTGAVFSLPEVLRFTDDTSPADNDSAIVNLRYVDKNGVADHLVTIARKVADSSAAGAPVHWWLYGNQQPIDSRVEAFVRRLDQLAPNPGSGNFLYAANSRYQSGISIFINKDGPGSTGLRAARVKGPGLPPAGLVYTRPGPTICTAQTWLNIRRKDGLTDAASATPATANGNIFSLQRTVGVSGADATTVRRNPDANTEDNSNVEWAHPRDYGAAAGAADYIDFSQLKALSTYTIEVFYDGETSARHTLTKTMLTPVLPATTAGSLQWVALDAATKNYLDPAKPQATQTATISLAWGANPFAEPIRSAGVYTWGPGGNVNDGLVAVAKGATTGTATAPAASGCTLGGQFPALTADGSSGRVLQLRYGVLDGGYKDSFTVYN